jgi:hypothetical protein
MSCTLITTEGGRPPGPVSASLAGTLASSIYHLKDETDQEGAYFVFGDLSVKLEGTFKLQFSLYDLRNTECTYVKSIESAPFIVQQAKQWAGMAESTALTRKFSNQGVRLRLRKSPRTLLRKRGPASEDYIPRHYKNQGGSKGHSQSPNKSTWRQKSKPHGLKSLPLGSHDISVEAVTSQSPHKVALLHPSPGEIPGLPLPMTITKQEQRLSTQSPYSTNMDIESQQTHFFDEQQSTQRGSYELDAYNQSPMATSTQGQSFTQGFCVSTGAHQTYDAVTLHPAGTEPFPPGPHLQQQVPHQPQYGTSDMMMSSSQGDASSYQFLDDTHGLGHISSQFGDTAITAPAPFYEADVEFFRRDNKMDEYEICQSAGQNLSAGSMGPGFARHTSHEVINTSAMNGPF